jgi:hypothetical protein
MGATAMLHTERLGDGEWCSTVTWEGCEVEVEGDRPCDPQRCRLAVMHHHGGGEDGDLCHFCPTGLLFCPECCGLADEPGEPRCTLWFAKE